MQATLLSPRLAPVASLSAARKSPCNRAAPISFSMRRSRLGAEHLSIQCSVRARWCLDARYGFKQDAISLLQEWVRDVGGLVGLDAINTRLSSGAIGAPESRLEMEVTFPSTAEWESFLGRIPVTQHKAWSQRAQRVVVDGSPRWEVYQVIPVTTEVDTLTTRGTSSTTSSNMSSATAGRPRSGLKALLEPSVHHPSQSAAPSQPAEQLRQQQEAQQLEKWEMEQAGIGRSVGKILNRNAGGNGSSTSGSDADDMVGAPTAASPTPILDWKGDPMVINPGDKLPFKFL